MVSEETILTLLQLVALTLPAIAIVLDLYSRDRNTWELAAGPSAPLHGLRLSFLWFILSGVLLLIALLLANSASPSIIGTLVTISIFVIILGLATFALPFVYNPDFLQNDFPIHWVYQNAYHQTRAQFTNYFRESDKK